MGRWRKEGTSKDNKDTKSAITSCFTSTKNLSECNLYMMKDNKNNFIDFSNVTKGRLYTRLHLIHNKIQHIHVD